MEGPCPCITDEAAPECRVKSPIAEEAELLGEWPHQGGYCTRGEGHEGDHIRCGGLDPGTHEIERWPQDPKEGDR